MGGSFMICNYVELDDKLPFRKCFAYMDTLDNYRADRLFRKYRIRVRFRWEWRSAQGRYCIVFCSVPKKQIPLFDQAMHELHRHLLILGYTDYTETWRKLLKNAGAAVT